MFFPLAMVGLYVLGVGWCCQVIRRFREDVREIRELKEGVRTGAIIFIWILTAIIAIILIRYSFTAMHEVASWFRLFAMIDPPAGDYCFG